VAEAFGLALIEAMACGLPVIACNSHGPAAIVRDGQSGWLVPPDHEPALAAALLEAATNPQERQRRGREAAIDARQRYGWTTNAAASQSKALPVLDGGWRPGTAQQVAVHT